MWFPGPLSCECLINGAQNRAFGREGRTHNPEPVGWRRGTGAGFAYGLLMSGEVIRCSRCGQANRIPDVSAGKKVVCGNCKGELLSASPGGAGGSPVTITDASFRSTISGTTPVLVDFWAPWCGPCRQIAPVIEALAAERSDVVFAKLNVDENPATSAQFKVSGIPTLILFRGGVEIDRIVGAAARPRIEQVIDSHIGRA